MSVVTMQPPCENTEFVEVLDVLSNFLIALLSVTVGWIVIMLIWRLFAKYRGKRRPQSSLSHFASIVPV